MRQTSLVCAAAALAVPVVILGHLSPVQAQIASPDHFQCYQAVDLGTPRFERWDVTLEDELETKDTTVMWPDFFCNPVDKEGGGINDPNAHLTCYRIKDARGQPRFERRDVEVADQFGELTLTVRKAEALCVPSGKDGGPLALNLDHFKCYQAREAAGTPKFQRQVVTLVDQFGSVTLTVLKPEALCNPVDKNGEGITNPDTQMTCYKIVPRNFPPKPDVSVRNQFGENTLMVVSRRTLCVPTLEEPPAGFCGDGITQPALGEECDDGNDVACDGCSPDCQLEFCGDGVVCPPETCDPLIPEDQCDGDLECSIVTCTCGLPFPFPVP
jgi:cysteine-rich repeat protein